MRDLYSPVDVSRLIDLANFKDFMEDSFENTDADYWKKDTSWLDDIRRKYF